MANAKVTISHGNAGTPAVNGVFEGLNFFLVQRLPSRSTFVERIQANGGRIVKFETQADHIIADHLRRDSPAGSVSYTFIDRAITDGELPDPTDYLAGQAQKTVRETGSAIPAKGTRTPFTQEDDRVLWQWVQRGLKEGRQEKGNELYKQLETVNPRHTYQSWRDRYIKYLMGKPPQGADITVPANAPPSPPAAQDAREEMAGVPVTGTNGADDTAKSTEATAAVEQIHAQGFVPEESSEFTEEDKQSLLGHGKDIVRIDRSMEEEAWTKWAEVNPAHSADEWREFWSNVVRPIYLKQRKRHGSDKSSEQESSSEHAAPSTSNSRSASPASRKRPRYGEQVRSPQKRFRTAPESTTEAQKLDVDETQPFASNLSSTQVIEILSTDGDSQETATAAIPLNSQPSGGESFTLRPSTFASEHAVEMSIKPRFLDGGAEPPADVNLLSTKAHEAPASQKRHDGRDGRGLLTEANLANQQAQHRAQLLRGEDLPEDNDDANGEQLDTFRRMLEDATRPAPHHPQLLNDHVVGSSASVPQAVDLVQGPQGILLDVGGRESEPVVEFMSSQQEIDDVFEANINWPESPKVSQNTLESQPLQFDPQISHSDLPDQQLLVPHEESTFSLLSQPGMEPEVYYPQLPNLQSQAVVSRQAMPDRTGGRRSSELESSWVEVEAADEEGSELASEDSSFIEDVDLSIPEPQSGWNSSSPAKLPLPQLDGAMPSKGSTTRDVEPVDDDSMSGRNAEAYYEIFSDTSSSSLSSFERAESISNERTLPQRQTSLMETQDILNAETQQPDLAMPLPSDSEESEEEELEHRHTPPTRREWSSAEDEQLLRGMSSGMSSTDISTLLGMNRTPNAIRNRHALLLRQNLQSRLPPPHEESFESDESSEEQLPSDPLDTRDSPPAPAPAPAPSQSFSGPDASESLLPFDGGDAYELYMTKMEINGYSLAAINEALKRTSMRPALADLVLLEMRAGKSLPTDVVGIWSEAEDRICEGGDARALRQLEAKHGWDEVVARMDFLQELRG